MKKKKKPSDYVKGVGEKICPVCKKYFIPAPLHAWRIGKGTGKLVCTYSCMRKAEKLKEEGKKYDYES